MPRLPFDLDSEVEMLTWDPKEVSFVREAYDLRNLLKIEYSKHWEPFPRSQGETACRLLIYALKGLYQGTFRDYGDSSEHPTRLL